MLSSNMIGNLDDQANFPHKLLLTIFFYNNVYTKLKANITNK